LWLALTPQATGHMPIVLTDSKNYTVNDYEELFEKSRFANGWKRY